MKQKLFVVATLIILQASLPSISAQQLNAPYRSYQQARRVLDDAIAAHGGLAAFKAPPQKNPSPREPLKKL